MNPVETASLRVERTFHASAEEVFDAWTNPEVLRRWWSASPAWRTPVADVDLRVGGTYRLSMENPEDGSRHTVVGEYRAIDRPHRLIYSWSWESGGERAAEEPGHDSPVSLVSVQFLQDGEHTTVVLEHSGLPSQESANRHEAGWIGCMENLDSRGLAGAAQA